MPTVTLTGRIVVDGRVVPGFPAVHTLVVPALQPFTGLAIPADSAWHLLPTGELSTAITTLVLQTTAPLALTLGAAQVNYIQLQPGGFCVLHDILVLASPLAVAVMALGTTPAHVAGLLGGS